MEHCKNERRFALCSYVLKSHVSSCSYVFIILLLVVYSKQVAHHLTLQGVFSVESQMPRSTRKPLDGLNATEARMRRQDVCDLLRRQKLVGGFKYFLFSSRKLGT